MRNHDKMRRTGRDRRDAGSYRMIRLAVRERDFARSEARELKGRGLVWNCAGEAAPSHMPIQPPLGFDPKRSAEAIGHVLAPEERGAMPPARSLVEADPPVAEAAPSADRSWLPEVDAPVVVGGVRIAAFEVAGGSHQPFYVLVRAD